LSEEAVTETASFTPTPIYDPETVTSSKEERKLMRTGVYPIGSRRRRAAIKTSENIPFEQLPYQCFQEARKILQADREEKLALIAKERLRISNLVATDSATINGGQKVKDVRLDSMRRHLEYLKIQADINDPLIKKRFEDGQGMQILLAYGALVLIACRRHDQTHLPLPRRQEMAILPTQDHRPADRATRRGPRCPTILRTHR
jgi:large subunit ribosomal protein L35